MIVAVQQPQFLPYLGFFHKVRQADVLVILDDVQFQKHGFQNRNLIKTNTGSQWLTVPIVHHFGQKILEVAIARTTNWRKKHWSALQTNYAPAAFFKQLAPQLEPLLVGRDDDTLLAVDMELMRWAMATLGITTSIRMSSELGVGGDANERLVEICRAVAADTYISGPGGRAYMDLALFGRAGVAVTFQDYAPREYAQLFPKHGFLPNLAVVDALLNLGPDARALIA
jgi:hypothetical protein